jgi:cell wall-associated NlpC family hydrolase
VKIVPRLALVSGLVVVVLLLAGCAGRVCDTCGKRGEVVSAALSQVGTPYRYGGNEPGRGLDCSGLTQFAHLTAGVPIPRMCLDQLRGAKPVDPSSLRPGDLVFFKIRPGVHHVGLMVDSDRFVHASTSQHKVQLTRLHTPYWTSRYLGAGSYLD